MAKNFDDILKKGKDKAIVIGSKNKKELFKEYILNMLNDMHEFNDLFENSAHNIMVTNANCEKCKKPTFILTVKNIDNVQQAIRFHRANWKSIGQGIYHCDKCKRG